MNKLFLSFLTMFVTLLSTFTVLAENIVSVSDGYIRETIPGTTITSAYMTLQNSQPEVLTLAGVTSQVSDRIEIHEHTMDNGMMKMRQRDFIVIPAQSSVKLKPGGLHLMIFDIKSPLVAEQIIPLTLHFSDGKSTNINMPVKSLKQPTSHKHMHHHSSN